MGEFRYCGLQVLTAKAVAALTQATTEVAEDLVGKAQPLARVDTGALRAGIHVQGVEVSATSVVATVSTGAETDEYSLYQHEGTRYMSGTHYLEVPLIEEAPVYREHIARAARERF
jgi:hypothetical protein